MGHIDDPGDLAQDLEAEAHSIRKGAAMLQESAADDRGADLYRFIQEATVWRVLERRERLFIRRRRL
jgi:hypothetical protein